MTKLFVKLTTGTNRIDNSMGWNSYRFDVDQHPTFLRPYLIEQVQRKHWGNGHDFTHVLITGMEDALCVVETPEQIMEQIEAIECHTTGESLESPECEHDILTGENGNSYCRKCGKEWR